jgi:hypothetical protein
VTQRLALPAVLTLLAVAAAGCGGAKTPSVASLGPMTTATTPAARSSGGGAVGGGSGPQTSSGAGGNGSTMSMAGGSIQQLTQFAACMRKNGEPSFPDPNAQRQISANVDPSSAQFQQAQQACQKLLPHGGQPSPAEQQQMRIHALAFSACMRSRGEPNFPDPQFGSGGRVSLKIGRGAGLDPRLPQFQAAQKACQKNFPGKTGAPSGALGSKTSTGGG